MKLFILIFFLFIPVLAICQSPYRLDWTTDVVICGSGVAIFGVSAIAKPTINPLTIDDVKGLNRQSINWFDRSATNYYSVSISNASDILCGGIIISPILFFLDNRMRDDVQTLACMYAETMGFSVLLPYAAKDFVNRPRPFVYNANAPINEKTSPDAVRSFFSSHSSTAFASAVFLSTVYGDYYPDSRWKPYIWVSSLTAASITGLLRYESGMHFPSDIIVGAIVGSAIGYAIPALHRNSSIGGISVQPTLDRNYSSLTLRYTF